MVADPAKALAADALQQPVTATWRDLKFTVPPPDEWLFEFSHHAERNRITLALQAMLGDQQYQQFCGTHPKLTDADALIRQIMSAFGLDAGESLASTGS